MASYLILQKILKTGFVSEPAPQPDPALRTREQALQAEILKVFGQAVAIRHVDAGSCNGCELEIHALNGPHYNIDGLGVKFSASPRHVDVLLVTGPVSRHMEAALKRAYDAIPDPKWVVAMGECACTGGMFGESYASCGKISNVIPVDVEVPGCPPTPTALLQGILAAVSKDAPNANG
ncbi:NADH-quinone oxidoreductase subunit B family protein [Thiobacillus sp.]|uniref:NADH-quinone oxidoreductase subunit B family protein n=1 Tax=Thiobacillus sp. TaxID=924 RepID=UPI001853149F|nr:NADH-quinone oxidoreductase subunit B family protein [Thiobacillus sp.]MBC2730098.1 NADH-quinone oxidoreductase subunit B family protein [Thiobacillus sp.]MBC2738836.1 NADH-quinone oxidoreductase subunit B family protein [Thiobacillus sp.]MBC2760872.1 NADH-quinone oxidoreductase subunit B family protein [Thiobacillus sp.]MBD3811861.1 NADH-quinone oxidoreductase subunit B family protein [Betaproteobacteria bacterium]